MITDNTFAEIYKNYDAFYIMTLSAAMVSSENSNAFDQDAGRIIDLLGNVFGLKKDFVTGCKNLILGDMMKVGLVADYHALSGIDELGCDAKKLLGLYEIKGRVIDDVNRSNSRIYFYSAARNHNNQKWNMKYESFHHEYIPQVRFHELQKQAEYGDINSTRQLALFYILGIGCETDYEAAARNLLRCIYWGDKAALKLLCYTEKLIGNKADEKKYSNLDKILNSDESDDKKAELAEEYGCYDIYLLITLIKETVAIPLRINEIDIAFVDVINSDDIETEVKLGYILSYKDGVWKNAIIRKKRHTAGIIR